MPLRLPESRRPSDRSRPDPHCSGSDRLCPNAGRLTSLSKAGRPALTMVNLSGFPGFRGAIAGGMYASVQIGIRPCTATCGSDAGDFRDEGVCQSGVTARFFSPPWRRPWPSQGDC